MKKTIYIINPCHTSTSLKESGTTTKKGRPKMAIRRRKKRKISRVRAVKKSVRRIRRRRKNPTKHRPVVYGFGRGKKRVLRRAPKFKLIPRMINPKKKRRLKRRRNPLKLKGMAKRIFSKDSMMNAILLLVGLGGAGSLKAMTARMLPEGAAKAWYQRLFGAVSISLGFMLSTMSKRKETKTVGTGMVAYGVYDLLVSNISGLQSYLPAISAPSAFSGYQSYGRSTYSGMMGAGLNRGVEVVGANISYNNIPEIVGNDDVDLADALDMSC